MLIKQLIVTGAVLASLLLGSGILPDSCWIHGRPTSTQPTSNGATPDSCWIRG
ncbi:MAG: hypothetical protein H0T73_04610 [Ardenticatenales bacterium]|nr:hypothetical protein [Ardenticatenales bacterium]